MIQNIITVWVVLDLLGTFSEGMSFQGSPKGRWSKGKAERLGVVSWRSRGHDHGSWW